MATIGPSTGNYGSDSILNARRTANRRPQPERLVDDTTALGGHRATYDPTVLSQRYGNDYQAEINRRTAIDSGDPTIAVLKDLREQKLSGQETGLDYSTGGTGNYGTRDVSATGLSQDYYDKYLEEQQKAILGRVNSAVEANNAYIPQVNQQSDKALQDAYIAREQNRVNAPQALSALGYTGGASETALMGINTGYENSRNQIEQNRATSLDQIRQNEQQIRATGDATLSEAAASYYDKLISAQQAAAAQAQDQANWQAEYDLQAKQYEDAAAQQAWQNAYDERVLGMKTATATKTGTSGGTRGGTSGGGTTDKNTSGNYNVVLTNVKRALGGSNAGSQVAWNAAINYIQNSLRQGMITEYEANQMINTLGLS